MSDIAVPKGEMNKQALKSWKQELVAIAAGGLAGGFVYFCASVSQIHSSSVAAAVSICVAMLTMFAARKFLRAKNDMASVVQALNDIGNGKFDEISENFSLTGAEEIGSAVHSMSEKIRLNVNSLREAAQHDPLTGLFNRDHFQQTVEPYLKSGDIENPHCILYIDIDGFKQVNDTLGHNFGDRLLQTTADRLRIATHLDEIFDSERDRTITQSTIHIARFGGDEFVVFLANSASGTIARKIASRILRVLSEPFELGAHTACVSASVGVAFFPQSAGNYSGLLRAADTAMYHAKRSGRNRCELYCPSLDDAARLAAEEEQELREAIVRGEFELYYQPLYDIRTMRITSAEALIRWHHPKKGTLLPGQFIPLAERANMTCQIGEWVIGEAVQRIAELSSSGDPLQISVNISPLHLEQIDFVPLVKSSLKRWHAPAKLLDLEITEDAAMRDPEMAAERLSQLNELGVSIAIDDFGTGYSNLASLIMLPLSRLKIDRSLLQDLTLRSEARVLVQTIVSMANSLGFHSVAEGVETQGQLDLLSAMGCDVVQGYLMSRPIRFAQLKTLLSEDIPEPLVNQEFINAA